MPTSSDQPRHRRLRGSLGATLVEYGLIIALVTVPAIGATRYLTSKAKTQTNNQADCVASRPPPVACQTHALQPTTTTVPAPSTTTTIPVVTTSSPPTTAAPAGTPAWDVATSTWNKTTNVITLKINLKTTPGNAPIAGAVIVFKMTVTPGGQSFSATCTSDAAGVCQTTWAVPGTDITKVTGTVFSIDSTPPTSSAAYPGTLTWV